LVQESTAEAPARRPAADLEQQMIRPFLQNDRDHVIVFAQQAQSSPFMHQLPVEPELHRAIGAQAEQHRPGSWRDDLRPGVAHAGLFHLEERAHIQRIPFSLDCPPAEGLAPDRHGSIRLRPNPGLTLRAGQVVRLHDLSLGSCSGDIRPPWLRSDRTQDQPSLDEVATPGAQSEAGDAGRAIAERS
jgi:hypothetical protein